MQIRSTFFTKIFFFLSVFLSFPSLVFAQSGASSSILSTLLLSIGAIISILAISGFSYGFFSWKNGTDANDIILIDRGRAITIVSSIIFVLGVFLLILGFFFRPNSVQIDTNSTNSNDINLSSQGLNQLILLQAQPQGAIAFNNPQVQIYFNQSISLSDIISSISIRSNQQEISGQWQVKNELALFTPNQLCSNPNTNLNCFDANQEYTVLINSDLTSIDGDKLNCSLLSSQDCEFTFSTGAQIDNQKPEVIMTYPFDQEAISKKSIQLLEASAKDDQAISYVEFLANQNLIGVVLPFDELNLKEFRAQINWDTSLTNQSTQILEVISYDTQGLASQPKRISVDLLSNQCFDSIQNQDELGIDCGGSNCRACENTSCEQNNECQSNLCFDGTCKTIPIVEEFIFTSGTIGDYITIRGSNFGEDLGQVTFLGTEGNSDDKSALFPDCPLIWSDNQIIIEIPEGVVSGPLLITDSKGFFDRTDDNKGGIMNFNFTPNSAKRPALCATNPQSQFIGETIDLFGANLGQENQSNRIKISSDFAQYNGAWDQDQITDITIPFMSEGEHTLSVYSNNQKSNPIFFTVENSPTLPQIQELSPDRGPNRQIISVLGQNLSEDAQLYFQDSLSGEIIPANQNLPKQCIGLGSSKQRAFRVPSLSPGVYQAYIQTSAGKSNSIPFRYTISDPLPGICGILPDNGPAGIDITIFGEGFTDTSGIVRFFRRVDSTNFNSWEDNQIKTSIPLNASSGATQIIDSSNNVSNKYNFTIGQCSPDTCEAGFECCGNGACQKAGTCPNTQQLCTYEWIFSTGDTLNQSQGSGANPNIPRVIENQQCDVQPQSPSPFINTTNACINAGISARFTLNMKDQSINTQTITVNKCNQGNSFDETECTVSIPLTEIQMINANQAGEGFVALPQVSLEENTWYQVFLSDQIQAETGEYLSQPYAWSFKTGAGLCDVNNVLVTPKSAVLNKLGARQQYTGVATAANCNILDSRTLTWKWNSSDTLRADVNDSSTNSTLATAKASTLATNPVRISASIPESNISDQGNLEIILSAPSVVNTYPNCSSACINALLGAKFDQELSADSLNTNNVLLYECTKATCSRSELRQLSIKQLQYNPIDSELMFMPASNLLRAGVTYRIVLRKGITNTSGQSLSNLNFDASGLGSLDSYSWLFTTSGDGNLCAISSVEVNPASYESFLIGEQIEHFSIPKSSPDQCNQSGQKLTMQSYDFNWASQRLSVAHITNLDADNNAKTDAKQITTSKGAGDSIISTNVQQVSGQADYKVTCGFESDSQCPSPATLSSHGVGSDRCCHMRPEVISVNPENNSSQICTTLGLEIQFNQLMDQNSLNEYIVLQKNNGAQACETENNETALNSVVRFISRISEQVFEFFIPKTSAQNTNYCDVETSLTTINRPSGSLVRLFLLNPLDSNAEYRIVINGDDNLSDENKVGVLSEVGLPMNNSYSSTFTTGDRTCSADLLDILVTPPDQTSARDAFFCAGRNDCSDDVDLSRAGNQHSYLASARDISGVLVPAEYSWLQGTQGLIRLDNVDSEQVFATPSTENGNDIITVRAKAIAPSTGSISRSLDVKVFICENPWPNIDTFPYTDFVFNYDSFYCRDFGEPGFQDDLPPLSDPIINQNLRSFAPDIINDDILQESLFLLEP